MFEASIDLLWGAIALSVLGVSGFLCYLLFHSAGLVRESRRTVEDVNGKLKRVDPALDALVVSLEEVQTAITSVRHNIVEPISSIAGMLRGIASLRDRFSGFFPSEPKHAPRPHSPSHDQADAAM